jgi:hypothetical protein
MNINLISQQQNQLIKGKIGFSLDFPVKKRNSEIVERGVSRVVVDAKRVQKVLHHAWKGKEKEGEKEGKGETRRRERERS